MILKRFFTGSHLRNVELEHVLDAVLEGHNGTGTTRARSLHLEPHHAVLETHVDDVTSIFLQ